MNKHKNINNLVEVKLLKNKNKLLMLGIIIIIILFTIPIISASFFGIGAMNTIEKNKTIELNGVKITVPETDNFTKNDSTTLSYYDLIHSNYENLDLDEIDNFNKEGSAHQYRDFTNDIEIMVINSSDAPYLQNYEDGKIIDSVELEGRMFQQKKKLGDKVVLVWVYDENGEDLSQVIIDSIFLA